MPHGWPARLIEKSCRPPAMNPFASFARNAGRTKSGRSSYRASSLSWYAERRKNQFRSSIHSGSMSCSGHLPSTSSASVLKASQPTQYQAAA